jgi:hypothetical protein
MSSSDNDKESSVTVDRIRHDSEPSPIGREIGEKKEEP